MKNLAKRVVPVTALVVVMLSFAPLAAASTLTVNLNQSTGLARVDSVSTTKIVFAYPAGSEVSARLGNVSSSVELNSSFAGGSSGAVELQSSFNHDESQVSVRNMTVALDYTARGNATALVIDKVTNVTSWVSGVFKVVNGSVVADLGWRSFVVPGPMDLDMGGRTVDINTVGSTVQTALGPRGLAAGFLSGYFGGRSVWNQATLNFTQLDAPLSTWAKNYDSATNTTTFTKTISGTSTFTSSLDFGGQKYSLSASSDPTGVIAVEGYASASGNTLVISQAPPSSAMLYIAAAAAIVVLGAVLGYALLRSRGGLRRGRPAGASGASPV